LQAIDKAVTETFGNVPVSSFSTRLHLTLTPVSTWFHCLQAVSQALHSMQRFGSINQPYELTTTLHESRPPRLWQIFISSGLFLLRVSLA